MTGRRFQDRLGTADDTVDADGTAVLNFWQAQDSARSWFARATRRLAGLEETPAGPYTVSMALGDYLTWMEAHRKSAAETRHRANALFIPQLGNVEVAKLTATRIRQWHVDLTKVGPRQRVPKGQPVKTRDLSADPEAMRRRQSTANRTLTILKACLNYAWREGKTPSDDAWRRVRPFPQADGARVRYLPIKDAQRLLKASEPHFQNLVRAALLTGARYGELIRLRVADYDRRNGTVRIGESKSGKGRHVVLNEEGAALFRRLTANRDPEKVILLKASGTAWGTSHQKRPMRDACKRAGINPPISFHELRHTWASLSLMAGAPHLVVSRNLGHADTRMVEKHYGHLAQSYIADTIRRTSPRFAAIRRKAPALGTAEPRSSERKT